MAPLLVDALLLGTSPVPNSRMKVGLFGGAFDPVHNAHLFIAEALRTSEGLDRVVFLPTGAGHHRSAPRASVDDRCAMLRAALAANPAFALDLSDTDESATGYTADLLPRMRLKYKGDELYFIVGGDSLVHGNWDRLDEILRLLDGFLVAPRGEVQQSDLAAALTAIPDGLRERVRLIEMPRVSGAATLVRERIEAGESVRYLVPEPVWRYIIEHHLYAPGAVPR